MTSLTARWLFSLWGSLALLSACSPGDEGVSDYRDNRGRVCQVRNDIQLVPATCNKTPKPAAGCSIGTPCFVVISSPLDTGQMQNCDTCCDSNNQPVLPSYVDCAPVTCEGDSECIYSNGRCQKNKCYFLDDKGAGGRPVALAGAPGQGGTAGASVATGGTGAGTTWGGAGLGGAVTTVPGGTSSGAGSASAGGAGTGFVAGAPGIIAGAGGAPGLIAGAGGTPGFGVGGLFASGGR